MSEPMKIDENASSSSSTSISTFLENADSSVVLHPKLDLEAYIASYSSHTRILRLLFIARVCPPLQIDAYRMAVVELKKTLNTKAYQPVADHLLSLAEAKGIARPEDRIDNAWIEATNRKAQQLFERLDSDLRASRNNLIKESIRMGNIDLGDHFYDRGELQDAGKCYARARDYCATSKQMLAVCLSVILVNIESNMWATVSAYISKAEAANTDPAAEPLGTAKLRACRGLCYLHDKDYKSAAKVFIDISFDIYGNYSEVLAAQDIAIYGGLCGLATLDRADIKAKMIDSPNFKQFLELVPEMRETISDFYASRYASMLTHLENMKDDLRLDIYLHPHVSALFTQVRNRALQQYVSPFMSVDMSKMAAAFKTTVADLEKDLVSLIMDGHIKARIDSHSKVLHARQVDVRSATFEKSLQFADSYEMNTKALLFRLSLMKANVAVRSPQDKSKGIL